MLYYNLNFKQYFQKCYTIILITGNISNNVTKDEKENDYENAEAASYEHLR